MDTLVTKIKITKSVLRRVFSEGRYLVLSVVVFFVVGSPVLLLPNWTVLTQVLTSDTLGASSKFLFWLSSHGSIVTNHTVWDTLTILSILILFSVNVPLLLFYARRAKKDTKGLKRSQVKSLAGAVSGLLGIGCAACGSVILTAVATSLGASGLLLALPLRGGEFALVGIVLLLWSISYLIQKINDPLTCSSVS